MFGWNVLRPTSNRPPRVPAPRRARLALECLESRLVMDAGLPVPALSSLVGAPATLYLDFVGGKEATWSNVDAGHVANITTPAFSLDGDATQFSAAEITAMTKIWQRVAEDYAPFNINVTTVNPGSFNDRQGLKVVIGGDDAWYRDAVNKKSGRNDAPTGSGTSDIGSFTNASENTVFVFSANIVNWTHGTTMNYDGKGKLIDINAAVATTASHESGHAFGLRHDHDYYPGTAIVSNVYSTGTADWTPIMGDNLASDRTTWAFATIDMLHIPIPQPGNPAFAINVPITQDEMAVIAGPANGFGYRATDHSQLFSAYPMDVRAITWGYTELTASGILTSADDAAYYRFTTTGGHALVDLTPAAEGPNLAAKVAVYRDFGTGWNHHYSLVASAAPAGQLSASLSLDLGAGNYVVVASGRGDYGDVGQYHLTVTKEIRSPIYVPPIFLGPFLPAPGVPVTGIAFGGFSAPSLQFNGSGVGPADSSSVKPTAPENRPSNQRQAAASSAYDMNHAALDALFIFWGGRANEEDASGASLRNFLKWRKATSF